MSSPQGATRAVILTAGLGSRLHSMVRTIPKSLVTVNGTPILHNALSHLAASGINEIVIVLGHRQEAIRRSCGDDFAGTHITYVESRAFDRTGSAYSLWLARDALVQGDVLLLKGDVFFERGVIERLLSTPSGDVAAVAPFDDMMAGTAVTLAPDNLIEDFRANQTGNDVNGTTLFKTLNLYRLSARTLQRHILPRLQRLVRAGAIKVPLEDVFTDLIVAGELRMAAARCHDLRWFEIDCEANLPLAGQVLPRQLDPLYRHMLAP